MGNCASRAGGRGAPAAAARGKRRSCGSSVRSQPTAQASGQAVGTQPPEQCAAAAAALEALHPSEPWTANPSGRLKNKRTALPFAFPIAAGVVGVVVGEG